VPSSHNFSNSSNSGEETKINDYVVGNASEQISIDIQDMRLSHANLAIQIGEIGLGSVYDCYAAIGDGGHHGLTLYLFRSNQVWLHRREFQASAAIQKKPQDQNRSTSLLLSLARSQKNLDAGSPAMFPN
jgi:hypothetical protein